MPPPTTFVNCFQGFEDALEEPGTCEYLGHLHVINDNAKVLYQNFVELVPPMSMIAGAEREVPGQPICTTCG
jgi:hypothetical protein